MDNNKHTNDSSFNESLSFHPELTRHPLNPNSYAGGEILPCPFCGGKPSVYTKDGGDNSDDFYSIECNHCNAGVDSFDTEEEAIKAWNTRVIGGNN